MKNCFASILSVSLLAGCALGQAPSASSGLFDWLPDGPAAKPGVALRVEKTFTPSGSKWADGLDERQVFHARLSSRQGDWQIGVGKGGQIYSLRGPFGEAIPPQVHKNSEWNDEVWQLVAVSQKWQRYAEQSGLPYFIHGSGIYLRDAQHRKNFYCPIIAKQHDAKRQSYAVMTWGQQAHVPTPFRSGALFTTRFRVIDAMTVEVVYGVHNTGDDVLDFFNVPWGGVRATTFPVRESAAADGSLVEQVGSFGRPNSVQPLAKTGGYLLFSQSREGDAASLGLVIGTQDQPWPGAKQIWRGGYAGRPERPNPRDYFVTSIIVRGPLAQGESFWARRFYVIGPRDAVIKRCKDLAGDAKVQRKQWERPNAPRLSEGRWAAPVPGSKPLFQITRLSDGKTVTTTDPYVFADKQPVANPLARDDPRHADYQGMQLLRPYAVKGGCSWRLMGFVDVSKTKPRE